VRAPSARVLSLVMYREYKSWAEQYGESPVSHKMFASSLCQCLHLVKYPLFGLESQTKQST